MKNWFKRIVALVLAAIMVFSNGIVESAAQTTGNVSDNLNDFSAEGLGTTDVMIEYANLMRQNKRPYFMYQENFGLPREVFWQADLERTTGVKVAQNIWYAAKTDTDKISASIDYYEAVLFEIVTRQLVTQKIVSTLSSQVNFNSTQMWLEEYEKRSNATNVEDQIIEFTSSTWSGLDDAMKEQMVNKLLNKNALVRQLEVELKNRNTKLLDVMDILVTGASNQKDLNDRIIKFKQLLDLQNGAVAVLDEMYKNVDRMSKDDITEQEKMWLKSAIQTVRASCDGTSTEKLLTLTYQVEEDALEGMVGLWLSNLADANPVFKPVFEEFKIGISLIDYMFDASDMFENLRLSYATNQVHNLLYTCWKQSSYCRYMQNDPEQAMQYVNTVWMLSCSYNLLLDNYKNYIKNGKDSVISDLILKLGKLPQPIKDATKGVRAIAELVNLYAGKKSAPIRAELLDSIELLKKQNISDVTTYYECAQQICENNQKIKKLQLQDNLKKKISVAASSKEKVEYFSTVSTSVEKLQIPKSPVWNLQKVNDMENKIADQMFKSYGMSYNSDTTLSKDFQTYGSIYLKNGVLDLNGHTLTVGGNFYQTGGHLYVNNGKLIVKGSYYLQKEDGTDENEIIKYKSAPGTIKMLRDADTISIGKDFVFNSGNSSSDWEPKIVKDLRPDHSDNAFYKGIIKVGGDISFDHWIYVYDTCEFKLTGGHPHTIKNAENSRNIFYNLTFQKTGNKTEDKNDNVLYWSGNIGRIKLTDDVTIYLQDREKIGKKEYGVLNDYGTCANGIDLNGHTMTLKGNVLCKEGYFNFNKGTLHVTGDFDCRKYRLNNDGKQDFIPSNTVFYMIYDKDLLDVDGKFTWGSSVRFTENQNWSQWGVVCNVMKAGKVKIGEDFIHEMGSFSPTGSNVIEMDGKGKKLIAVTGKINILKLDQPMSQYTINPDDCYVSLYQEYHIKFDGNGAKSGKMSTMKNCVYGQTYKLKKNQFKRPGYTFTGWNTKANGSGKTYKNMAAVKNLTKKNNTTVTLYAQWKKK